MSDIMTPELAAHSSKLSTSGSREISGARLIAETLVGYGVTHVFFMESVLRQTMIELEDLGVKRVLAHSEAGVVYMADGYARVSRRHGVCMAQSVGAANMAAALQDPALGCIPVVALTGKKNPNFQHRNAYQELPHHDMFESTTKFNATVETLEQLPRVLRLGLRSSVSGTPGPAHIDLAGGFAGEAIEGACGEIDVVVEHAYTSVPPFRPAPEQASIDEAVAAIGKAKRPIIVAGGGVRSSNAAAALIGFAEKAGIPVATTLNAKGSIAENHPLCVGVTGTYSRRPANMSVHEADLVVFIGSKTSDQATTNWTIPGKQTTIVQIDIDPAEIGRSYPAAYPVVGDIRVALEMLTAAMPAVWAKPEDWSALCAQYVADWHAEFEEVSTSNAAPIVVERLCRDIQNMLPDNAILVADTGFSGVWTGALIEIQKPGQDYIRAAGSLGWAFPAALGAKCAAPDRPVICFIGDGGFWYHLSELETALRWGINTITIVNNNSTFGQCMDAIHRNYGDREGKASDLYRFTDSNFAAIAETIGCMGIRVERPEDFVPAMQKALAADRPVLIDVVTDPGCRAPAPWSPPAA